MDNKTYKSVDISLSKTDLKTIKHISSHISKIDKIIDFQKYNKNFIFNEPNILNLKYETSEDLYKRDKDLLTFYQNKFFILENTNVFFFKSSLSVEDDFLNHFQVKLNNIYVNKNYYTSSFVHTKWSDLLIQISNYVLLDDSKKEKVDKFIENIEDDVSKKSLQDFYEDFMEFKSTNELIMKKEQKWIKIISIFSFSIFIISVFLILFFLIL